MPYLIDGHNLIGQMSSISLADPDDEAKLVRVLQRHYARTRQPITVVFDPGTLGGGTRLPAVPGVTVVFASSGEDADAVLIRRIEREKRPRELTVVSSDRRVMGVAQACGAQIVRSQEFAKALAEADAPSGTAPPKDDKPEPSKDDIDHWMGIFREPPPKPPRRSRPPRRPKR